jgi:hypothetical protein
LINEQVSDSTEVSKPTTEVPLAAFESRYKKELNDIGKRYSVDKQCSSDDKHYDDDKHYADGKHYAGDKTEESTNTVSTRGHQKTSYRVFMSNSDLYYRTVESPLYYECNGVVIDSSTWKCISVHAAEFNRQYSPSVVNANISSYDIYDISDGTIVTLYPWKGRIGISTSNGFDVSNIKWFSDMTYAEIIYDLMVRLYPEAACEVTLFKDENETYLMSNSLGSMSHTIGFKHYKYHPLRTDPERIWYISSYNANNFAPIRLNPFLPGIELSKPQTDIKLSNVDDIKELAANSTGYGYILRSRTPIATGVDRNLIFESPLLKWLSNNIYRPINQKTMSIVPPEDRLKLNIIKILLNANRADKFNSLFPEWKSTYTRFVSFTERLIDECLIQLQGKERFPGYKYNDKTVIGVAANMILDIIHVEMNSYQEVSRSILKDYIMDPDNAIVFINFV